MTSEVVSKIHLSLDHYRELKQMKTKSVEEVKGWD